MSGSSTCRSCGRPIVWAVSQKTGKNMPFDAQPSAERGNFKLVSHMESGRVAFTAMAIATTDAEDVKRYTSHFVTCPDAKQWRRPR